MRRTGSFIAVVFLLMFAAAALAASTTHNRYRWKDAQGNLHYDDALPNEALQFGYDVVNGNGLVIRHVAPPKTDAQIKADAKADAEKNVAARAAAHQAMEDKQMLVAYPNERDLVDAQKAQLGMIDQYIEATQISLQSQEKSLADNLAHAADLERAGKPVPTTLAQQIESLRTNIEKQKAYIVGKQQEKLDSAKQFADELAHYRALRSTPKQP
ncbi:MAG: DUF4124 domain-containing protein [Rudaea sp.]